MQDGCFQPLAKARARDHEKRTTLALHVRAVLTLSANLTDVIDNPMQRA